MEIPSLRLRSEEYGKIEVLLSTLLQRCSANCVFLISRSGQEVAFQGDFEDGARDAVASLAAGQLAAVSGLAQVLGEREFERVYHRGRRCSVLVQTVGDQALLLIVLPNEKRGRDTFHDLNRLVMLLEDLLERGITPGADERISIRA